MPVFNADHGIREAIDSILGQTVADFELLAVNDRSTDASESVINEYARHDERIILLQNENEKGIVGALNTGLEHARGEYLARMDADDISVPQRFEKQLQFLEEHDDVTVCGSWIELFGTGAGVWRLPETHQDICCAMLFSNAVTAVMMRKFAFDEGPYRYSQDFNFAEDYELWVRVSERHRLANFPEVLYRYRRHDGTIGSRERTMQPRNTQKVHTRCLTRLGIAPTESESELHAQIANYQYRPDKLFVERACAWLDKVVVANAARGIYDQQTLTRHLGRRRAEITSLAPNRKHFLQRIFHR
jgi:glycosyltransferase involved in cell wall biosynthesis